MNSVAYYVAYALIVLTAATSLQALWRRREMHRLDILALVSLLVLMPLREQLGSAGFALPLAVPYVLLRLVQHFRNVPGALRHLAVAMIPTGALVLGLTPPPRPPVLSAAVWIYVSLMLMYAAAALSAQARKSSGVTARRLGFAALGTWLFATLYIPSALAPWLDQHWQRVAGLLIVWLYTGVLASYYFAFSTPRRLRTAWQQREQAKYLNLSAELDAETRGQRTAQDLSTTASRSVGNDLALVALRPDLQSKELVVEASSDRELIGIRVAPRLGLLGQACESGSGRRARVAECEPELASTLGSSGEHVLIAPILTPTRTWGVVLVTQRRGSLFPEDDLRLLEQLGRHAGTALDHAQLLRESRERERKAADRRIREAESRMSLMLDNIRDYAMFVLDHEGRVVSWHSGARDVFGYTAPEMIDEPAAQLFEMAEDAFLSLLVEARRAGRAEYEGACRRRDGGKFLGATLLRPLTGDDYDLQGFVAVTRDVSERRELEQRLRQSQKMEAIGRLAGGIAHDFNNLLTAILGYADFLAEDFANDAGRLQQIQEIQKGAERAAGLTRQLLAFSRQQLLEPKPVNLSRLTGELVPMLRRLIGEHIEIVEDTRAGLRPVLGDHSQLEQVIVNLAVNARDAMPNGGRLTIRTASVFLDRAAAGADLLPGPYALLEVADTGVGMDVETQARIFEPFFTTKAFGVGTGLGLSTVYGIVKQMGGAVRVISAPDQGTIFRLYFPETLVPEPTATSAPSLVFPRGDETVLLVEDESAVRTFMTQVLERQGYRVLTAEHQASALAVVRSHPDPIHLVITDVVMPGGSGPELMRALHAVRPDIPALYISGYADAVLAQQGTVPKASQFLQKPFSAGDLLARIRQILARPDGVAGL